MDAESQPESRVSVSADVTGSGLRSHVEVPFGVPFGPYSKASWTAASTPVSLTTPSLLIGRLCLRPPMNTNSLMDCLLVHSIVLGTCLGLAWAQGQGQEAPSYTPVQKGWSVWQASIHQPQTATQLFNEWQGRNQPLAGSNFVSLPYVAGNSYGRSQVTPPSNNGRDNLGRP
jgi:hypothetical protein